MKIDIGNKNKINNSNIGEDNKIESKSNSKRFNFWTMIFIPILVSVIAGIIVWAITKK